MLEVRSVRLALTTDDALARPSPPRPEIAFVGRSNVGKSSLLNSLVRRKRLAYTSRQPGKTRTVNYYAVDDTCYFVDLPGYGYAAVPAAVRERWRPLIEGYLGDSPHLVGIVWLIDGRHPPTALDREMVAWLADREVPTLIVLTKADKVRRGSRRTKERGTSADLGLEPDQVVWFSSRTGEGREAILSALSGLLEQEAPS